MGTRSLTHIHECGKPLLTFYRQFDGYPSGHGSELAKFLDGFIIVNGISSRPPKIANGMGCLAAQIIKEFKEEVGGFYIYPAGSKDCGEEFIYHVRGQAGKPLEIEIESGYHPEFKSIFKGSPAELLTFVEKENSE